MTRETSLGDDIYKDRKPAPIGDNLRAARYIARVSPEDVAELAGLSPQMIHKNERSESWPNSKTLLAYAEATGYSVEDLMGPPRVWQELLEAVIREREQAELERRLLVLLQKRADGILPKRRRSAISSLRKERP
jgi:transcriptional regulator with XRE-family HTH domain